MILYYFLSLFFKLLSTNWDQWEETKKTSDIPERPAVLPNGSRTERLDRVAVQRSENALHFLIKTCLFCECLKLLEICSDCFLT